MLNLLKNLFAKPAAPVPARQRISANTWPTVIYAIGDIHGCRKELDTLIASIVADAAGIAGEKWLVLLGDYIDRGPQSAGVLDLLCTRPPAGFRRICLAGNHEIMFLEFLENPRSDSDWLRFGGLETLESYGIAPANFLAADAGGRKAILTSHIPDEHIELLREMPVLMSLPDVVFVHAGIRPGMPLDAQSEDDLLWMREPFLSDDTPWPFRVIHGHTPDDQPIVLPHRICVDTGAFATGILTAVRITSDGQFRFINSANQAA